MFLLYVDESGDSGLVNSPTKYYVLSGLLVHELRWQQTLDHLLQFRKRMKADFGLKLREEIHAANLVGRPGPLGRIPKHHRLAILRAHIDAIAAANEVALFNVVVCKEGKPADFDVFEAGWTALLRTANEIVRHWKVRAPKNTEERLMILPDRTEVAKLDKLVRTLRNSNPSRVESDAPCGTGFRNAPLSSIIEDPSYRDSAESYFIQAVDTVAWTLYQFHWPCSFVLRKGGRYTFNRLTPVLIGGVATGFDKGVIHL